MKRALLGYAFFRPFNLGILSVAGGLAYIVGEIVPGALPFAYPAAAAAYLVSVIASLSDSKFAEHIEWRLKFRQIKALNSKCSDLAAEARNHTNNTYDRKLRAVLDDKKDIYDSFIKDRSNFLKERIVEKTINLVNSYIGLLTSFCIRNRELSEFNPVEMVNRINANNRKYSYADPATAVEIRRVIEMDEKLLKRIKAERTELERIGIRLDFMESTVNLLKQQLITSVETEDMVEQLDNAVNEASALESVLDERRRNKLGS